MTRFATLACSTFAAGTFALAVNAAPIAGVTYTYDNAGDFNGIAGKDVTGGVLDASIGALTDGIGQAGVYTPASFFWEPGNEGTIYNLLNSDIDAGVPQPEITFDLGASFDLANVVIHYGERTPSGIEAPLSVEVLVDGSSVGTFGGFDQSDSVANFGDIRSNTVDLTGQTGQLVTLRIFGDQDTDFNNTFVGLTEVEFNAVPEPGSLALLGLGGLALLRRRRA